MELSKLSVALIICAMVLANGQYMFSCDGTGSCFLKIPLDNNGQFKLQVYADGFAPSIRTFDEFMTTNIVRMARAVECQQLIRRLRMTVTFGSPFLSGL
jgi:hypothetical protein